MARRAEGWKLWLDQRTGIYFVRFRFAGQRRLISTGTRDIAEATKKAPETYAAAVYGIEPKITSGRELGSLIASWLADLLTSHDETTTHVYEHYARSKWLSRWRYLEQLKAPTIEKYWRERLGRVTRSTLCKELSALRGFLSWCVDRGYLTEAPKAENPPDRSTGTRVWDRKPVPLSKKEAEALFKKLPEFTKSKKHNVLFPVRARFVVAWETTLRPGALDKMRAPKHYRPGAKMIDIDDEIDKMRQGRPVPLSSRAQQALESVCPPQGLIFGKHDYRKVLRNAAAEAGFPAEKAERISSHGFRHAAITDSLECTDNLVGVQYMAGHRFVSTTARYVQTSVRAAQAVIAARQKGRKR